MKKTETKPKKIKETKVIEKEPSLSDLFDGIQETVVEDEEVKKTGYKLDMFRALEAANRKDWNFYDKLTDDEKKGFAAPVMMRWLACPSDRVGITASQLYLINNYINPDFWLSTKHPGLVWRLFCAIGTKKLTKGGMNYSYIKANSRKSHSIDNILLSINPRLGDAELTVIKSRMTRDKYINLLRDMGKQDKVIKELVAEYDKYSQEK